MVHRAAADGGDGLVGDHVEAAGLIERGDALGVEHGPAVDERAVVERAVGDRALGLIHGNDHRTGGIGHAVVGELLRGKADLDVVAGQPLHHGGGSLEVGLVLAVERNDVALGIEVAVLTLAGVLGTEEAHFRALHVVLVAQPLADELKGVGVEILHAALVDGHLALKVGELFAGDVAGLAEDAVLHSLRGIVVVGGQLDGIGHRAVEHGELRRVAG